MRYLPLLLAVALAGCGAGSIDATPPGDVQMSVADAVWWTVSGTGDPGTDGSVLVLMSDHGDLCHELSAGTFTADQELFALGASSGTSDHGATKGSYPAGVSNGPRATGRRYEAAGASCRAPAPHEALASGSLVLDDPPAGGATLHGTFAGAMDDGAKVDVTFSASSCDAAAGAMNGLADDLQFRSCGG